MRNRRINIHGFLGNAPAFFGAEVLQRAHVMQTIGELDQHHAHIVDHRQQHLAHVLRLLLFAGDVADLSDLGQAFD